MIGGGFARAVIGLIVLCAGVRAESCFADGRPFTVRDSIEMRTVIPIQNAGDGVALFSPDEREFVIQTRRSDIASNKNINSLLLFDTNAVRRSVERPALFGTLASSRKLVEVATANDWGGISHVAWSSNEEVTFLASDAHDISQVFSATRKGKVVQLTHSPTSVTNFAIRGDVLLYFATEKVNPAPAQPVESQELVQLVAGQGQFWTRFFPLVNLYRMSRRSGRVDAVNFPASRIRHDFQRIWISPRENFAVVLLPAIDAPRKWADYQMPEYDLYGYSPDRVSRDPTSMDLQFRLRYMLVNLSTGDVRPLLDAPSGLTAWNQSPIEVFWPTRSESVIVSNTYLPLRDSALGIDARKSPAVVEVNLRSGSVIPILMEPSRVGEVGSDPKCERRTISHLTWNDAEQLLDVNLFSKPCSSESPEAPLKTWRDTYRKLGSAWDKTGGGAGSSNAMGLAISIVESMHERPLAYASVNGKRARAPFYDPNPQLGEFTFGATSVFHYIDKDKVQWTAGLVLPVGYTAGKRYPLVIQTHGFSVDEFLTDGPNHSTSAYAAQPLANAGFVVLQVEDNALASTNDETEAARYAEGFRSAIEKLVGDGLVDRDRVGIIGWSRSGYHVLHLLAEQPGLVAAAIVSDCAQFGYWNYLLSVNRSADIKAEMAKLFGTIGNTEDFASWEMRLPVYKLRNVETPVRMEAMGAESFIEMWESYALMKAAGRPVDYVYYPSGSHSLLKPAERLESQGGAVDWFRLWLQEQIDIDPNKKHQYERWAKLRSQAVSYASQ